jgi:hypothetical protein
MDNQAKSTSPGKVKIVVHRSKSGKKRSWSAEGMEVSMTPMMNIFRDRRYDGRLFNDIF